MFWNILSGNWLCTAQVSLLLYFLFKKETTCVATKKVDWKKIFPPAHPLNLFIVRMLLRFDLSISGCETRNARAVRSVSQLPSVTQTSWVLVILNLHANGDKGERFYTIRKSGLTVLANLDMVWKNARVVPVQFVLKICQFDIILYSIWSYMYKVLSRVAAHRNPSNSILFLALLLQLFVNLHI